jgi:hypothetical protein
MSDDVYPNVKRTRASRIVAAKAQGWSGPWRFGNKHLHGTPPCGKRQSQDGDHVPDDVKVENEKTVNSTGESSHHKQSIAQQNQKEKL